MMSSSKSVQKSSFDLMPLLFVFLWSTGFIGARFAMPYAPAASFLTTRYSLAIALLIPLVLLARIRLPHLSVCIRLLAVGAMIHGMYLWGVFWAVKNGMAAGIVALIVGVQPMLVTLIAQCFGMERINAKQWLVLALGFVGLVLVLTPVIKLDGTGISLATFAAAFFAAVGISAGTVLQKSIPSGVDIRASALIQFVGAIIPTATVALIVDNDPIIWNAHTLFALAWLTLVLSIGAIFLLLQLVKRGTVSETSSLFYLVPGVSAILAFLIFKEQLYVIQIGGFVLTAVAVAVFTRFKS